MRRLHIASPIILMAFVAIGAHTYVRLTRCGRALKAGMTSLPDVTSFTSALPQSKHTISYCTGQYGSPTWNASATFFDRYVLTMKVPIRIDYIGGAVTHAGPPTWDFVEIMSVRATPAGASLIEYGATRQFTSKDWDDLMRAAGRIESVFTALDTSHPVHGFRSALPP